MLPLPMRIIPWLQSTSSRFRISVAVITVTVFYVAHFLFCAYSALPDFVYYFTNSDMNANLQWARGIVEQGWLNPHPYHPYNDWMQEIAPYETWVQWWGGEAVFQQSPLYAYLLAAWLTVGKGLLTVHLAQCLGGALLCVLLALLAAVIFESRHVGWATLFLTALYGRFYGYSWPLLRDLLGWILIVSSILALTLICRQWNCGVFSPLLAAANGVLLGLGLLARETFYLIIPAALLILLVKSIRNRRFKPLLILSATLALTLSPLVLRNAAAGAGWLSTSNRFAENFIEGNARAAKPAAFSIPSEMGDILRRSDGRTTDVISQTLASHADGSGSWARLQLRKVVSLFDPYEPPDNLSLYYLADVSPFVRFGLPHWLIFIPGLGGLLLGIWKRDRRQVWLWTFLACLLAGLFFTTVLSRYRQSLALFWIPWAAWFLFACWDAFQNKSFVKFSAGALFVIFGWWFCLQPHSFFRPPQAYPRATEYRLAAVIYEKRGRPDKVRESLELLRKQMPDLP